MGVHPWDSGERWHSKPQGYKLGKGLAWGWNQSGGISLVLWTGLVICSGGLLGPSGIQEAEKYTIASKARASKSKSDICMFFGGFTYTRILVVSWWKTSITASLCPSPQGVFLWIVCFPRRHSAMGFPKLFTPVSPWCNVIKTALVKSTARMAQDIWKRRGMRHMGMMG